MFKKYFIAIMIPPPLGEEIEGIKQGLFREYNLKGALRCAAHITLHRPFSWKEENEDLLKNKLRRFGFAKEIEIHLKDFSFFEPRVIYADVLSNETLNTLHHQLTDFARRELQVFNEYEDLRGFHPHVTIASRDLKKDTFFTLKKQFIEKKIEGQFVVKGFSLLKLEKKWEEFCTFPYTE